MTSRRLTTNVRMALQSIRSARGRSLLTMFGIVIGVVAVLTTMSIGEGIKRQVHDQVGGLGDNTVTVSPGRIVTRNTEGEIDGFNLFAGYGASNLTQQDLETIKALASVESVAPLSLISGVAKTAERSYESGTIMATTADLGAILGERVPYGSFFGESDDNKHIAVIGRRVAEELFGENVPIGKIFEFRGKEFVVRGILEEFNATPFALQPNFNQAILIPYGTGNSLSGGSSSTYQMLVEAKKEASADTVANEVRTALLNNHAGQEDFTVLRQEDNVAMVATVLDLLTILIVGIAAVSLFVGGIGIMNIMLVVVTERTHEIGIRKAIGATNRQISSQFLTEAIVLSTVGGIVGVIVSYIGNFLFRIFTDISPVVTWQFVALALGTSVAIGVFFGVAPAIKAARKDPIDSLRFS